MLRRWLVTCALVAGATACSGTSQNGNGDGSLDGQRGDGSSQGDGSGGDGNTQGDASTLPDGAAPDADDASAMGEGGAPDADDSGSGGDGASGMDVPATDTVVPDVVVLPDGALPDVVTPPDVVVVPDAQPDVVVPPDSPSCSAPTQSCYSAAPATAGVGVCRRGTQQCVGGTFGACMGELTPTAEACNGLDDDCNGAVDDGLGMLSCGVGACRATAQACVGGRTGTCTPLAPRAEICGNMADDDCDGVVDNGCACVYVSTAGNDTTGTGSATAPFRTIQTGINRAGMAGLANVVCVAGGTYAEAVTMRSGVSVLGGYAQAATPWARTGALTTITNTADQGVLFNASVSAPTSLDGFTVNATNGNVNAAVTITGSTGAIVSGNLLNGGNGTTSVGVNISSSPGTVATPQLLRNGITGGNGTALAVGVWSTGAAPLLQANCQTFDAAGRCQTGCPAGQRGIRGRAGNTAVGESYGVRLEASPNAVVDTSGVCSGPATTDAAAVRIMGNSAGVVVRASSLQAFGANRNAVGVWAEGCGGASPWIVNNYWIVGNSPTLGARADGVRSVGACHAVVDGNVRITGGIESANNDANGVLCAADSAGTASRCTVLNNTLIQGSGGGFPPNATGVRCENGSCIRIEGNALLTGQGGINAFGVTLINTGAVVARNVIQAGCGQREGTGIRSENSYARVDDNQIFGNLCAASGAAPSGNSWGVRVFVSAGTNELDLHSNDIFAEGPPAGLTVTCTSRAVSWDSAVGGAPPSGPRGLVRNNILHPGRCTTRYAFEEVSPLADPRVLQNNDLWFQAAGDVLYRDEAATNLAAVAMVNSLADITSGANLSADPLFVGAPNYRLQMTSPCVNAGTASGAPALDFYNVARPRGASFDIGAAEF